MRNPIGPAQRVPINDQPRQERRTHLSDILTCQSYSREFLYELCAIRRVVDGSTDEKL